MKRNFVAPPFDPGDYKTKNIEFVWWSWNPNYPYWSKSCWKADTEKEAWFLLQKPEVSGLRHYHNKLIKEENGVLTEVADLPYNHEIWKKYEMTKTKLLFYVKNATTGQKLRLIRYYDGILPLQIGDVVDTGVYQLLVKSRHFDVYTSILSIYLEDVIENEVLFRSNINHLIGDYGWED